MQVKELNQALFAVAWQQLQDRKSHNNLIERKCREGLRMCQKDLASAWFCGVLKGNAIEIAFNVKYLIEGFKTFDCQNLALNMNTATAPVTFEDAEELADRSRVYLVMPIQIRV